MERFQSLFGEVELTEERKAHIINFHPDVKRRWEYITEVLSEPEIVRRSKSDPFVLILYWPLPREKRYLTVVIKTNQRNFILTIYITDKIQHQPL